MHKPLLRKGFLLNHVEMRLSDTSRCGCMVSYCIDTNTTLLVFCLYYSVCLLCMSVMDERGGEVAQLHPPYLHLHPSIHDYIHVSLSKLCGKLNPTPFV